MGVGNEKMIGLASFGNRNLFNVRRKQTKSSREIIREHIGEDVDSNCYNEFYGHHLMERPEIDYLIVLGQILQLVNQ